MSDEFRIPAKALPQARLALDGSVEEVEDTTPPLVRHLFPDAPASGEQAALRDLDALERAGVGWWLST